MNTTSTPSPAAEWASRVSNRRYRKTRHELDELVVNTVPSYAAFVNEELDRFEKSAVKARVILDGKHKAGWALTPAIDRLGMILAWVVLACVAVSVALAFPGGGRTGVTVPVAWMPVTTSLSSALFAVAVVAQAVRWAPYVHHVPPKDGLAWITLILGIPMLAWTIWLQQQDVGIPLAAVILESVALLVSIVSCLARLVRRLRDPRLTQQVDAAAKERTKKLRTEIVALANTSANRLIEKFTAIPGEDQARLRAELDRAAARLEARHLVTAPATSDRVSALKNRRNRRGIFPGLLLLSRRVKTVNSQTAGTAQWIVGDYVDDPTLDKPRR